MKYFHINPLETKKNYPPEVVKVPEKFLKLMQRCIKYNNLASKCEKEAIKLLAKANNVTTSEIDDLMATYDWGVDQISYGRNVLLDGEITEKEYKELLKRAKNGK